MSTHVRKTLKPQGKLKGTFIKSSIPGHVRQSRSQLLKMEAVIKNLLSPFVGRIHLFETQSSKRKRGVRKTRKET